MTFMNKLTNAVKNAIHDATEPEPVEVEAPSTAGLVLMTLLPLALVAAPAIIDFVKSKKKPSKATLSGIYDSKGVLINDVDELSKLAHEGLAMRERKAQEAAEAEFDRKVAQAVKKALQGKEQVVGATAPGNTNGFGGVPLR